MEYISHPACTLREDIDFMNESLPEVAINAPGMISPIERKMLHYFARQQTGWGVIADLGIFLGASGICMASGLSHPIKKHIKAYELGVFPRPKNVDPVKKIGATTYILGESFVPQLQENIKPYSDVIELRIGDICDYQWNDGLIELLFIDAAKTEQVNQHIFETFFPHLRPGAIVIQQDFFFDRLPWIKVLMGYFDDNFEWLGQAGPSSIYRYLKPISDFSVNPYSLPVRKMADLHNRALNHPTAERRKFSIELSLSYLYADKGYYRKAEKQIRTVRKKYLSLINSHDNEAMTPWGKSVSLSDRVERCEKYIQRQQMKLRSKPIKRRIKSFIRSVIPHTVVR